MPETYFEYIDSPASLEAALSHLRESERIALDTEADSLYRYTPRICLIQLAAAGKSYVVDPLARIDLMPLFDALKDKPLLLHGGDYDLRMMRDSFSFRPHAPVFDTMLAARLLGFQEIGLAALIKRFFGVAISKAGQKSNWSQRPLTPEQMEYAAADVHYLERIADYLHEELHKRHRAEWHRESCEYLVRATGEDAEPDRDRERWRIKGCGKFTRLELAFVRGIWGWREDEARRADLPPFKVVDNHLILELALWAAAHVGDPLERGPKLPRNLKGRRLELLKAAMRQVEQLSGEGWPEVKKHPRTKPPNMPKLTTLIEACARAANVLGIEPSVLATRASLESLAHHRPREIEEIMAKGSLMRWQAEVIQPIIRKLYA